MANRPIAGRLTAGLTAAVVLGAGWSGAFPAIAHATHLDLSVTSTSGTATQTVRVGDVVSEEFRVAGLPSSGNDLILTVTVGSALEVSEVAPSAGGAAYACGAPVEQSWGGRQVICKVSAATGSPLGITVTASATELGLTSQFVQLEAQPVGGDATPTSGNVAWTTLRVLEHDLEIVPQRP